MSKQYIITGRTADIITGIKAGLISGAIVIALDLGLRLLVSLCFGSMIHIPGTEKLLLILDWSMLISKFISWVWVSVIFGGLYGLFFEQIPFSTPTRKGMLLCFGGWLIFMLPVLIDSSYLFLPIFLPWHLILFLVFGYFLGKFHEKEIDTPSNSQIR